MFLALDNKAHALYSLGNSNGTILYSDKVSLLVLMILVH